MSSRPILVIRDDRGNEFDLRLMPEQIEAAKKDPQAFAAAMGFRGVKSARVKEGGAREDAAR